jgi:hypothetical protein
MITPMLNFTHDPAAQSWVAAAQSPGCDSTGKIQKFELRTRAGSVGAITASESEA